MQTEHNPSNASQPDPRQLFPTLTPGQKLAGCYLLKEEKHLGAVTSVWMAFDEVLGKEVSLHFIPQAVRADEKAMDELRNLIRRNRQLVHPSILRIYDLIEENDWAAISTDGLAGECLADLRSKKAGGFFEIADVKPWLAQLCTTLDDAHKIQLVHGDLSPEHLFVDAAGQLTATNFGIARCLRDALWRAESAKGGTPPVENLSPQMLDGQAATPSDDVYGAGVFLHEMLAGQAPFAGPDLPEQIRNAAAPKLMERRSERQRAGGPIPPNWEKVSASCLEKASEQRPKSLADLSAKLGLSKAGSKADEVPVIAATTGSEVAEVAPQEGPVIPVVKKAWVGSKSVESLAAGAASSKPADRIGDPELDVTDQTDSDDGMDQPYSGSSRDSDYLNRKRRGGFPVTGVAAATLLGGLCAYAVFWGGFRKSAQPDSAPVVRAESADEPQYAPVKNAIEPPAASVPVVEAIVETPKPQEVPAPVVPKTPVVAALQVVEVKPESALAAKPEFDSALTLAANKVPKAVPVKTPSAPSATPAPATSASEAPTGPGVAAKTAALEAARKSVEEWDKAHATMLKKKEQAEAAIAEGKKALDEKMKAVAPMLKASDEVAALRQQREEDARAAEQAANEAKKLADEKARLAEEAKKAASSVEKENKDKIVGQKKAEAELDEIKKAIAENERLAAESSKLADGAMAKRGEQAALVKQKEQEVAMAMAAAEIESQKRAEMEEKRGRIMKEMDEAKRLFEERMEALKNSLKSPETPSPLAKPPGEKVPSEPKAPAPPTPPAAQVPPATPPAFPPADSTLLAKLEKPPVAPAVEPKAPAAATESPATNSLGIRFAPVGDVQFAVWPTRIKDFEAFASSTGLKSTLWKDPGFKQGADHPVVNVTWLEAMAFCKWLTFKEQREGTLPAGKIYRLPTDLEWSKAVGLPEENGKTAEARDMGIPDVYPWGTAWPPPQGSGNYTGEETGSDVAIKGYSDGFPWTSPVGSFPANKYGLFDMGGNVWQWVMDQWNVDATSKVLRGASWYNGALKLSLLSSCRVHAAQDSSTDNYGFRCVIASESAKTSKR